VEIFDNTPVKSLDASAVTASLSPPRGVKVTAKRVALATNAFPSLLKRYRLHTVPVYDYVLMTEPLTKTNCRRLAGAGVKGLGIWPTSSTTTA
jgi:glycine/D-amino acid oxidase-like deaminating enzyme